MSKELRTFGIALWSTLALSLVNPSAWVAIIGGWIAGIYCLFVIYEVI